MDYSIKLDFSSNIKQLFWVIKNISNLILFKNFNNYGIFIQYNIININNNNYNNNNNINIIIGNHVFEIGNNIIIKNTINYNGKYKIIDISNDGITINKKFIINENFGLIYLDINNNNNISLFNPISNSIIQFDGIKRNINNNSIYYNIIQPYQYQNSNIKNGINIFNFGLYPESYQSSGYFNFNVKIDKSLDITLDNLFYNYLNLKNDKIIIKIYGIAYKIIRFSNGNMQFVL